MGELSESKIKSATFLLRRVVEILITFKLLYLFVYYPIDILATQTVQDNHRGVPTADRPFYTVQWCVGVLKTENNNKNDEVEKRGKSDFAEAKM